MFDSLKSWINVPYQFKPFIKRNGAGTKIYGDTVDSYCYPVGESKLITDASGAEAISMTQLYIPGAEPIKLTDTVIFNGEERPIQSISEYYMNGTVDVKVVYL